MANSAFILPIHIFIIGAAGGVGSKLGPMLVKAGHKVTALHRKPEQESYLTNAGMKPCFGDIMKMTADDLTNFTKNIDIIVFSAGAADSGLEWVIFRPGNPV